MTYDIQSLFRIFIQFTQQWTKVTIVFYIKLILFTINTCKQWRVMKAKNLDNERMYPFVSNATMNEGYYGLTLLYILYFCVTEYIFSDNKVSFFINDFPLRVMRNGMKKQLWPWISNLDNDKLFFRSNKRCLDTPQKLFLERKSIYCDNLFIILSSFIFCNLNCLSK